MILQVGFMGFGDPGMQKSYSLKARNPFFAALALAHTT